MENETLKKGSVNLLAISRCRRGSAAVEMALLAPILLLMLAGIVDVGRAFSEAMRLGGGARIGAQQAYATLTGISLLSAEKEASVRADIIAAVRDATKDSEEALGVTVAFTCPCPDNPGSPPDCGSSCTGGATPPMWIDVTVSGQIDLLFALPGVPNPFGINEASRVRVR